MLPIRYERHLLTNSHLPFIFHTDIVELTKSTYSNWHDNTEFLCCFDGSGTVYSDNEVLKVRKGDTIIINARSLHYITSDNSVKYYCLIVDNSFFDDNGFDISSIRFASKLTDKDACEKMDCIRESFRQPSGMFRIAEIRIAVLNYIMYLLKNHTVLISTGSGGKISKSHEAILKSIDYIDKNYEKHLTVDEIASVAGFSKYHFSRLFKSYTGYTVIEHINGRRCENAKLLLEDTTKSVAQISSECGFESCSYFAKAFQKNFSIPPSAYRKNIGNNPE